MNKTQKFKALRCVRAAIKGWAFAPDDWLPRMIERAEGEIKVLPDELKEEGEELIQPLREIVSRNKMQR